MAGRAKDGLEESMMSKKKNATPSHGPKLEEGDLVSCEYAGFIVYGQVEWERAGVVRVKILFKTQDSFISHDPPQYMAIHRMMLSLVGSEEPEMSENEEEHNQRQDPSTQTTPSTGIGTRTTSSTGTGADRSLKIPVHQQQPTHVDSPEVHETIPARTQTASTSKPAPLEQVTPQSLTPEQHQLDFSVGDVVLVKGKEGTVCWIGYHRERRRILVGLDMLENRPKYNFGDLHGYKLFDTGGRRSSLFVIAQSCTKPVKKSGEPPKALLAADFELEYDIDSRVELDDGKKGTVKWIGQYQFSLVVGLVMDEANAHKYNSGQLGDHQVFDGPNHRCYIVSCEQVKNVFEPDIEHPIPLESNIWGLKYEINSHVELEDGGKGVVRWIGRYGNQRMVGLIMDEADKEKYHHGFLGEHQVFTGPDHRCHFVRCDQVKIIPDHPDQGGPDALDSDDPFPVEMIAADLHLDYNIDDIVRIKSSDRSGKVRWIGNFKGKNLVGLEMEEEHPSGCDGSFLGHKLFDCSPRKGLVVRLENVTADKRFGSTGKVDTRQQHGAEIIIAPSFSVGDDTLKQEVLQKGGPGGERENAKQVHAMEHRHPTSSERNQVPREDPPLSSVVCDKNDPKPREVGLVHQTPEHLGIESEIGDRVQLKDGRSCTLKWTGTTANKSKAIIGVEMDEDMPLSTDGTWIDGHRYFECPPKRALFFYPDACLARQYIRPPKSKPVTGNLQPPHAVHGPESVSGSWKGIQGSDKSHNLEMVVYSLFAHNNNIDDELLRVTTDDDEYLHEQLQQILKENIVNPLRETSYVSADHVEELLNLIDTVRTLNGILDAGHDPVTDMEYLLNILFGSESLMKFSNGMKCTCYPIGLTMVRQHDNPTVQMLLEESLFEKRIQFKEPPGCLLVHTSASGDHKEMYPNIMPSFILDVTYMLHSANRSCHLCGGSSMLECRACFENIPSNGLGDIVFCAGCNLRWHGHADRQGHQPYSLPDTPMPQAAARPRQHLMELFAVVTKCESRYLSYVKSGSQDKPLWLCMDAKKEKIDGIKGTFYTPTVDVCEHLQEWLADKNLLSVPPESSPAPLKYVSPLVKDAYIYFYRPVKMDM